MGVLWELSSGMILTISYAIPGMLRELIVNVMLYCCIMKYKNLMEYTTFISFAISEIVRLLMSMQVDRINHQRLFWSGKYVNPNSKEYRTLEGESNYAVS